NAVSTCPMSHRYPNPVRVRTTLELIWDDAPHRSETMPAASGGVRVLEERPPLLDGLVDSAHPQLPEPGLLGPEVELPAELGQGAVALAVIALPAAGDEVLPTVDSPTRARNHMVDRRGGLAAVGAAVVGAAQDSAARQGDATTVRRAHIAGQQDDRGLIETHMLRSHRNVLSGQHCRFAGQHEHHGACERYDRQRLVSGIQHESLHISPLIFIANGPKPAAPAPGNTKGAVLMGTTPGKRARRHVCTPHQRLERLFDPFDYAPSAFLTFVRIGPGGS